MNKKFKFHKFKVFLTAILLLGIFTPTGTALADEYSAPNNYATTSFKATNNKNIWSEAALNSSKVLYFDSLSNRDFQEKEDGLELRRKFRLRVGPRRPL